MAHIVTVEPYCVLCHETLMVDPSLTNPEKGGLSRGQSHPEPWQNDAICFFDASSPEDSSHQPRYHSFRANLSEPGWTLAQGLGDWALDHRGLSSCFSGPSCRVCSLKRTANLTHVSCLQLARKMMPTLSIVKLGEITKGARPMIPWQDMLSIIGPVSPLAALPPSAELSKSTDLGRLLCGVQSRLPVELQNVISQHLSGLFMTLGNCLLTMSYLMGPMKLHMPLSPSSVTYPLANCQWIERLGADTVNVLGETCLTRIGAGGLGAFELEIDLATCQVSGIQAAFGRHGVAAVRVLYLDGSSSEWLGGRDRKRFVTYQGDDLRLLQVFSDGLKLLRLGLRDENYDDRIKTSTPTRMLWDRHTLPPSHAFNSLIDVDNSGSSILGNPDLRLGNYLSLAPHDDEVRSLTMFCTSLGVSSIQINGDPKRQLGKPWENSCPVTLYFDQGETVTSMYALAKGSKDAFMIQGPYLLVRTSKGRTMLYGPQCIPFMPDAHLSDFGVPENHRIIGAFIDPSTSEPKSFTTIGVTTEPLPSSESPVRQQRPMAVSQFVNTDRHSFQGRNCRTAFMTKAHLLDVEVLKLQRVRGRCVGMFIGRRNGTVDILGQWDPANVDATSTLYERCQGSLNTLTFAFSNKGSDARERYVEDILLQGTDLPANKPSFTWSNLEMELSWWFTFQYDHLEYWQGASAEIRVSDPNIAVTAVE